MSTETHRDPAKYQIKTERGFVTISNATRDEIEKELMEAQDLIQHLENKLTPLVNLIGDQISGKDIKIEI
jgi:hypothetical protein